MWRSIIIQGQNDHVPSNPSVGSIDGSLLKRPIITRPTLPVSHHFTYVLLSFVFLFLFFFFMVVISKLMSYAVFAHPCLADARDGCIEFFAPVEWTVMLPVSRRVCPLVNGVEGGEEGSLLIQE